MRMTGKQLKKLEVETLSGTMLGHIVDCIIDPEQQTIVQYEVKPSKFSGKEYLVGRDQVVRFEETKMIVYDTALPNDIRKKQKESFPLVPPEPAAMREE